MKVEIQIDNNLKENKIVIQAKEMTEEISDLMKKLLAQKEKITVYLGEETYFLKEDEIESVYSSDGKVFVKTKDHKFQSKSRLYELEQALSASNFIRISNSEIVNFDKVQNINTKLTGTIVINFFSRLSNLFI